MKEAEWIKKATAYMVSLTGPWKGEGASNYCGSLYETYVKDMGDDPYSPTDAVDEDMSYWEE